MDWSRASPQNGEMPQMSRNPQQAMAQMGKCLDPRMLKQIGGMHCLQVCCARAVRGGSRGGKEGKREIAGL